jgi:hypothetical protein
VAATVEMKSGLDLDLSFEASANRSSVAILISLKTSVA